MKLMIVVKKMRRRRRMIVLLGKLMMIEKIEKMRWNQSVGLLLAGGCDFVEEIEDSEAT